MLKVTNRTPFAARLVPAWDRDAREVALLVVKCTFHAGANRSMSPAAQQAPVCLADEYYGDPEKTCIRTGNDLALSKPAVDVVIVGSAYAPGGVPTPKLEVGLLVGGVTRVLRVTGDRAWVGGMLGYRPTAPVPFRKMPLTYDRSYGGIHGRSFDMRNPVGRGYRVNDDGIAGALLPNVEWADVPVKSWRDRPEPAGLGFVAPAWQPRVKFAGTYDQAWLENRLPFLPKDFDDRHFQAASPRLTFPVLTPGSPFVLEHATPEGSFSFNIPDPRFTAVYHHDRERGEAILRRDTVVIEPDARRVILVHRALIPCGRNHLGLREVVVGDLSPGRKRALLKGKRYLDMKSGRKVLA